MANGVPSSPEQVDAFSAAADAILHARSPVTPWMGQYRSVLVNIAYVPDSGIYDGFGR
jgi:hypothetical protein